MKKVTKRKMIEILIDEAVNPNWRGAKAEDERAEWEKELKKRKWADLKADYDEVNQCNYERILEESTK